MIGKNLAWPVITSLTLAFLFCSALPADEPQKANQRKKAYKEYQDGNYKDAYELYAALALDPNCEPNQVGNDLSQATYCLNNLGRPQEIDAFREKVIEVHAKNWRLLSAAAQTFLSNNHYGYLIAGEFHRGYFEGSGTYVNSEARDRVRALQLMMQAMPLVQEEDNRNVQAGFFFQFAQVVRWGRTSGQEWRFQSLTNLEELPDYEEGYYYHYSQIAAPVDEEGNPLLYTVPATFEEAKNDGERWRWLLEKTLDLDSSRQDQILMEWGNFLHQQFGVQTLSSYGHWFGRAGLEEETEEQGSIFTLHTLSEDETIAKLAGGVKRFTLEEEYNFIKIFRNVAENTRSGWAESAWNTLAGIFENRQQYDKAAECWLESIERHGDRDYKRERRKQILDNFGQFEPAAKQPAGQGATVQYRFRNGTKVSFEAHEIKIKVLLEDTKAYLKANPSQLDWERVNVGNVGYRLVKKNQTKYLGKHVASWDLDLEPRPKHFDKRITVTTPLQKAGAYLVTAKMQDGNTSKIILWVNDTVIVKKHLDQGTWIYVADALTGEPVPKANVEFFGYRQERVESKIRRIFRHYNVLTDHFAEFTDGQGQLVLKEKDLATNFNWLITATTGEGRLAYLGFTNVWFGHYQRYEYNQVKTIFITDRPVYRPDQTVKLKAWVRQARYDLEDQSLYANRSFRLYINNPRGERFLEKNFTTDAYGGFDDEIALPKDAMLGVYRIWTDYGSSTFRVEEYKKPEFEVTVEAPTEPVMLGEKIKAKIKADYYFGAPVTNATVKYKVFRTSHTAQWYPIGIWDWFYGSGYWWFAYDYVWYPGWYEWGMRRPHFHWIPWHQEQPELVLENEVEIGEDGTVEVTIDTAFAKEVHGDQDHAYRIEVEVR
ncbi:MAG: MG2 domain-containing protein, partial [Planctomycetota bacterium]